MTDQPTQQTAPPPQQSSARGFTGRDLKMRAREWGVRPFLVVAAMQAAGKTTVATPDEAKALVEEFLKKPVGRTYP